MIFSEHNIRVLKTALLAVAVAFTSFTHSPVEAQTTADVISVRGAEFGTYTRVAVAFPANTQYQVSYTDTVLTIALEGSFNPDLTAFAGGSIQSLGTPTATFLDGRTVMAFGIPRGATVEFNRVGAFLVVDVFNDGRAVAQPRDEQIIFPGIDVPRRPRSENPGDDTTTPNGGAVSAEDEQSAPVPPVIRTRPRERIDVSLGALPVEEVIDFVITGEDSVALTSDYTLKPTVEGDSTIVNFLFEFPAEAAAAVFKRGDMLWIVFDRAVNFDGTELRDQKDLIGTRVRRLTPVPHPDALILRLALRGTQNTIVEKEGPNWRVSLKDTNTAPRFPLNPTRRIESQAGQQLFIAATEIGRKITVEDPDIGDEIIILPMHQQGYGLAEPYRFPSAEILQTAQGVAVIPRLDDVQVERFRQGIAIAAPGVPLIAEAPAGSDAASLRLVDFASWRLGNAWEYRKNKALAQYQLSVTEPAGRAAARWQLARFYLGHRRGAEALSVLRMMAIADPSIENQADFRAVRGIANYFHGRHREALADLTVEDLGAEQDAELWKVLVTEKLARHADTLVHYRRGKDLLGNYEAQERAAMQLAVIRSALEMGDADLAADELNLLRGLELSPAQSTEATFQTARLYEQNGDPELALAQYEDLSGSSNRSISARARLAALEYKLANGLITAQEAIDQLDLLRYAWRDGQFEFKVILELASLHLQEQNFQEGLDAYRDASALYPDLSRDLRLVQRMRRIFRELFVGEYAQSLSPLELIPIFWRYQELTPSGAEGDTMVRRLADRLVDLDLLPEAANLYTYQVSNRLKGIPRAQIAIRLAKIHLLNDDPQQALETMRATREPRLPQEIADNRLYVEARALAELKRYEEADVLLTQYNGEDADRIRADIYWQSSDYARAIPTLQRLLGDKWQQGVPLDDTDRFNLMRLALGMSFLDDRDGLNTVRERYQRFMQNGDFANSFDLLTREEPLTGREIGVIAGQIADIERLQGYLDDYRSDFMGR